MSKTTAFAYNYGEVNDMLKYTVTDAQPILPKLISKAVNNEVITITDTIGNVVIMNEQDYRNITETLFIENNPAYKRALLAALAEPKDEYIDASEVGL
jgi:PHD/YefM family antitoxin component YafN of YafNO toxin-antitoxin module